ncbi:SRPBCC family protein [Sinomicrobium kalidii]|uniref:SRPBCC family protein n=1 Tax=Sinomicrobium kalidii TaxID=2900738 RepID=UPI001E5599B3|nr:SRPBCC family protein [Sinomicrobium kalidii]UGU16162.1 SRPBCC family protein [Sinomicrobium kalidii]
MAKNNSKCVEAQMLIRRPPAAVFEAFVNPEITRNFWFTRGSGKLEPGKSVTWEWEMYNLSTTVFVEEISENEKISIRWDSPPTTVDFEFTPFEDNATYVVIKNYGFKEKGDELLNTIKDSTGGFTTVLDGLKAYLEYGIHLNLIGDKFPEKNVRYNR